jgi:LytS/YehU family sensor histidine kinase
MLSALVDGLFNAFVIVMEALSRMISALVDGLLSGTCLAKKAPMNCLHPREFEP